MKTEEFILQELEKDRIRAEGGPVVPPTPSNPKSKIKFMIAGEAPVVVARACELLIKELTLRAWQHTERNRAEHCSDRMSTPPLVNPMCTTFSLTLSPG